MDLQERIVYNKDELFRSIDEMMEKLREIYSDSRFRELLGDNLAEKLRKWEHNIRDRKNDPYTIVVCGEFKRGKSSLINALLREDAAVVNITAETVTINRITMGQHSNEATLSGGRRLKLSDEEMCRERLEDIISESGEKISRIELQRPIEFLEGTALLDTPGMSDSLEDFTELTSEAIEQADAVVYAVSANYPISLSERILLKTIVLPQKHTDLFLAVNFTDALTNKSNYERMKRLMEERAEDIIPDGRLYMLSALDERCRQLGEERPAPDISDILENNFDAFRAELERLMSEKKGIIVLDRMLRLIDAMKRDVNESLDAVKKGLEMTENDIFAQAKKNEAEKLRRISSREEKLASFSGFAEECRKEAAEWMNELLDRMYADTVSLEKMAFDDIVKYYSLYCAETIEDAFAKCIECHTSAIYDKLDDLSADAAAGFSSKTVTNEYDFRMSLNSKTWTKGDNVSYIASKFVGFSLVGLVTDGIGGAMRSREIAEKTPELVKSIRAEYASLRIAVNSAINDAYGKMSENAYSRLNEYYTERIDKYSICSEEAAAAAVKTEEQKAEIDKIIFRLRYVLETII